MKSNYKRIGNYIREISNINTNLSVNYLRGISSIYKNFIISKANVVGVDFLDYKIVKNGQFAYNPNTARMGDKIPIALNDGESCIVSKIYPVFEIIDKNLLNPEYLMMWFRRPEFDRYARFKSHGSAREVFDWEEMCNTELPVPHIDKQKEIVKEYNVLVNHAVLNNQLFQKLEETAKAIYKQWFVDFEFPDENDKPYKSSGGKMVESELGEIPKGWEVNSISSLCEITSSKRIFEEEYTNDGVLFYRGKEISLKKAGEPITDPIYISSERYNEIISLYGKPEVGDILLTAVGTIGSSYMVQNEKFYFKDGNVIWFRNFKNDVFRYFLYDFMQSEMFNSIINEITIGSTQSAITITTIGQQKIVVPQIEILEKYKKLSSCLNNNLSIFRELNIQLSLFKDVLLSKLATIKN